MEGPRISAVVCTRNRAALLDGALESLRGQSLARELFEIVVVDNGSTDGTRDLVLARARDLRDAWGREILRCVSEPRPGISRARNRAIEETRAPVIAYLDDDARANEEWLANILRAFEASEEKVACAGGPCEPIWEAPRPAWLPDSLLGMVGIVDLGAEPLTLEGESALFGANIAYRRRAVLEAGGFDESLGRVGKSLLSNEEVDLWHRLRARGACGRYDPRVRVRHIVPASRLTQEYFFERCYWQGISDARMEAGATTMPAARRWSRAVMEIPALLEPRRIVALARSPQTPREMELRCRVLARWGRVRGMTRMP